MTITGGKFSFDPSDHLAEGYVAAKTGDYREVGQAVAVAEVNDGGTTTNYGDFATALSNWTSGTTLTLLNDVTTASTIRVSGTKTLDLNGHTITKTAT